MKVVSSRPLIIVLTILAIFALACATGSRSSGGAAQQTYENPPMQGGAFMELRSSLEAETNPGTRLQMIREATNQNYFLSSQVRSMVDLFIERDERIEVVRITQRRIVDMNNSYTIVTGFAPEDRDEVHAILEVVHDEIRAEEERRRAEEEAEREARRAALADFMQETQRADQEHQAQQQPEESSSSSSSTTTSSSSSAYCCLGSSYNECSSGAAAADCGRFFMCFINCGMGSGCEDQCVEEHPLVEQCRADPSKDHLCEQD